LGFRVAQSMTFRFFRDIFEAVGFIRIMSKKDRVERGLYMGASILKDVHFWGGILSEKVLVVSSKIPRGVFFPKLIWR